MSKQNSTTQAITLDARAYPIAEPKNNTLAFASVTINGAFAVHGIRVMDSEKGKFVAMPSMKDNSSGDYRQVCHPITADFRNQLSAAVMEAFEQAVEKGAQAKASVRDEIKSGAAAKAADAKENAASGKETAKKPPAAQR